MKVAAAILTLSLASTSLVSRPAAQSPAAPQDSAVFRSGASLVALNVTVTDSKERFVTGLEVRLHELEKVYAGMIMWPIEAAREIAHAWREWTGKAPDELTSNLKLIRFPPFPEVPDPLRGRALVAVGFAFDGDEEAGSTPRCPVGEHGATVAGAAAPRQRN